MGKAILVPVCFKAQVPAYSRTERANPALEKLFKLAEKHKGRDNYDVIVQREERTRTVTDIYYRIEIRKKDA